MGNVRELWIWTWDQGMQRYAKRYKVEWFKTATVAEIRLACMESDSELPTGKNQHGVNETIVTDVRPLL